jgi:hypothetical protein
LPYPNNSWEYYDQALKQLGDKRPVEMADFDFLVDLELVLPSADLTSSGQAYFDSRFIDKDSVATLLVMQAALTQHRPVLAVVQRLFGVPKVNKSVVDSLLHNIGLADGLTDRKLGSLLGILAKFEVISYVKSRGEIVVLHAPLESGHIPSNIFISRDTPFSNVMWLTRVLLECKEHIYWLDKHFQSRGFEAIADAADGNRVTEIRILSLSLPNNSTPKSINAYKALKVELLAKKIAFEWRTVDSSVVRDTHDRWIIGIDNATNVPDVGTIFSGNKSEMSTSSSATRLNNDFLNYWALGSEMH